MNRRRPKIKSSVHLARACYIDASASDARVPELAPLVDKKIAVFGLGCLGAPSAMEFARAGAGQLALVDHDYVDPATIVRWPRGLVASGWPKVALIQQWIREDYPFCTVEAVQHRVGAVRRNLEPDISNESILERVLSDVSLIYDATTELGAQHFLTDLARECHIPYVGVSGTYGAWGGKVFRFDPRRSQGCWMCYRLACEDGSIPEPPSDSGGVVQPRGCADPTFTGSSFDMMQVAMAGVRTAVSTLCADEPKGYAAINWDILHIALRTEAGEPIPPRFTDFAVGVHAKCEICNGCQP